MSDIETVKVKAETGNAIINLSDYDPNKHELVDDESKAKVAARDNPQNPDAVKAAKEAEEHRIAEANRGQIDGNASRPQANASGTFDEPTPTDVRFPNKNTTEFESNHGAQVGKSAAGLREELGMEQKPGGLHPEVKEKVDEAEKVMKSAMAEAAKPESELPKPGEEVKDEAVEIPDDWQSMHWRSQVALAEKITGKSGLNAAEARQAIEDESDRRKAEEASE